MSHVSKELAGVLGIFVKHPKKSTRKLLECLNDLTRESKKRSGLKQAFKASEDHCGRFTSVLHSLITTRPTKRGLAVNET